MANDRQRAIERAILGDIWTTNDPYEVLRELCDDIGHRYAGSESEKHGAEFLKRKMEDYGLQNVRLEEFQMAGWERGSASLTLVEPVERSYSCVAMPYCPAADLTAEVIDVGEGEQADFERAGPDVRGKIVISAAATNKPDTRKSPRTDKYAWAVERGAEGYLQIQPHPGQRPAAGREPGGASACWRSCGHRLDFTALQRMAPHRGGLEQGEQRVHQHVRLVRMVGAEVADIDIQRHGALLGPGVHTQVRLAQQDSRCHAARGCAGPRTPACAAGRSRGTGAIAAPAG